jgi:DNA-3-methyladenine glycosylase II
MTASDPRPALEFTLFESSLTDTAMRTLVGRYGPLNLSSTNPFAVLVRSVIAQQISTKAADTIRRRIEDELGLEPASVSRVRITKLRRFGLSEAKAKCLRTIATLAESGEFEGLHPLPDHEVTKRLMAILGVGRWTAEMFLIFGLRRPDVWPVKDAGLRAAASKFYRVRTESGLVRLGRRFRPYRSFAARYLWKSLENS